MNDLEFYRDDKGDPIASGDDKRLATFLQTDIQGSTEVAQQLLDLLESPTEHSQWNGNAHSITISPIMATIEASFDEDAPDRRMQRMELHAAVSAWLKFIR